MYSYRADLPEKDIHPVFPYSQYPFYAVLMYSYRLDLPEKDIDPVTSGIVSDHPTPFCFDILDLTPIYMYIYQKK